MKKQTIKLNEEQFHSVIKEAVMQCLNEEVDEGWWDNLRNGVQAGMNSFRNAQQMDNMPDKYNPWNNDEIVNVFNQLNARESQLQKQLNQLRNKKQALMKQYGVTKGKGNMSPVSRDAMSVNTTGMGMRGRYNQNAANSNMGMYNRAGL